MSARPPTGRPRPRARATQLASSYDAGWLAPAARRDPTTALAPGTSLRPVRAAWLRALWPALGVGRRRIRRGRRAVGRARSGRARRRVLPMESRQARQARRDLEVGAVAPLRCLHEGAPDRAGGGPAEA